MDCTPQPPLPNQAWLEYLIETATNAVVSAPTGGSVPCRHKQQAILGLIENDLRSFALPFLCRIKRLSGDTPVYDPSEYHFLSHFLPHRAARLARYLREATNAAAHLAQLPTNTPHSIRFLDGDSHAGGKRPLLLEAGSVRLVIKHTDPRPYSLLKSVLDVIESDIGSGLEYPKLCPDPASDAWQILPFLAPESTRAPSCAEPYMFRLGMITATAYFLGLTDIHLENLIAYGEMPVIVDPECMFSGLDAAQCNPLIRLASTGCVALNPRLSSITGTTGPLLEIGRYEAEGSVRYGRHKCCTTHRLKLSCGSTADPKDYAKVVDAGFQRALHELYRQRKRLQELCASQRYQCMRTRYIYRQTLHYKCYLELLFTPAHTPREILHQVLLNDLAGLPPIDPGDGVDTKASEAHDLLNGDIPYFYLTGDTGCVMHETGPVSALHHRFNLSQRIRLAIDSFSSSDFAPLGQHIRRYLETGTLNV